MGNTRFSAISLLKTDVNLEYMHICFMYNWPMGTSKNLVTISLNAQTLPDQEYFYRVGVVPKADNTKVAWQGETEWISHEDIDKLKFAAELGDKIVVDKKNIKTEEIGGRCMWNTEEDWPTEANGGTSVSVPFDF